MHFFCLGWRADQSSDPTRLACRFEILTQTPQTFEEIHMGDGDLDTDAKVSSAMTMPVRHLDDVAAPSRVAV